MALKSVRIVGIGKDLPGIPITNDYLLTVCNLTDDKWTMEKALKWTEEKLGIETRFVARDITPENLFKNAPDPRYHNSTLCANAIRKALDNAKLVPTDLDMIIVATATPDYPIPGTSAIVQEKLEIPECAVLDVRSACCGSLTGLITAIQYLQTGFHKTIAVVGCDVGSIFGNLDKDTPQYERQDFVNAMMIGDGAGAVILRGFSDDEPKHGIEITHFGLNSIGPGKQPGMWLPLGGSIYPGTIENINKGLGFFKHDYKAVMDHGPELFLRALKDALSDSGLSVSDVDLFVPHQANGRIASMAPTFGVPYERMFHNFERVGNTANASVMICMADIAEQNTLPENATVLVASAESTKWLYAYVVLKWTTMTGVANTQIRVRDAFYRRWYASVAFLFLRSAVNVQNLWRRYFSRG